MPFRKSWSTKKSPAYGRGFKPNFSVNILNTSVAETVTQPITKVEGTVKLENPVQLSLLNEVPEGQGLTIKWTLPKPQTGWPVADNNMSARPESFLQLSLFDWWMGIPRCSLRSASGGRQQLLHETYTNLDRLAVQFLLQPRETAPSSPQAFTDKLSAFFVQFSRLIDPFKSLSITCPQFWQW